MEWLLFALVSTASYAATNVLDKLILSRYVRRSTCYLISLLLVQQIFTAVILFFKGAEFLFPASVYAMIAGAAQVALYVSYFRALRVEEVSRVISLIYIYPLFVFLGAFLLLGESLNPRSYAGAFLLVISGLLVSYRPAPGEPLAFSPALGHLFFFWIFSALSSIGFKYLLAFMDEWHLFIWSSLGSLLTVLPFLADREVREETLSFFRKGAFVIGAVMLEETLDFMGRISAIFAYAHGSVTLVSSVGALQPSIALIYVISIGIFMPGILKEEIDQRTLILKLAAVALVAAGVFMISY
jgi:uncharacterized membrane protein